MVVGWSEGDRDSLSGNDRLCDKCRGKGDKRSKLG